jgi:hypothetical protein
MVGRRLRVGPAGAVHPTDVADDPIAQRSQQLRERAVEVVAVAAAARQHDPPHRVDGIDPPPLTGVQPHRLVRDAFHLATMQSLQRLDRRGFGIQPEPTQIRRLQFRTDAPQ